jgi:tripartite-type tricarboxylate transporter receptor subunit TctC
MRRLLRAAAFAAVAVALYGQAFYGQALCGQALAQNYPAHTITLIVPYPPGGGVDAMARVVAEKLAAVLGQQVVVDNRAGGSALIGTRAFIKSPPDGYTLFLGHTGSISINPSLYTNAGFDPRKDFAPIGLIASMPLALLAHPSFPATTIGEAIAIAKSGGTNFNIGTSAVGTGGYLTAELFKSVTGIDATIIPYKGTAQVMNDLLGNHVPIAFGVLPPALGNLQAGTLRAIAVLGPARFSLLPDVPTAKSRDFPDSSRCCITGCWPRRARRGRSSSVLTARYAWWSTVMM